MCKKTTSSTGCVGERYQVEEDRNRKFAYVESYLMIKNTKYPRDHGNYTCVANNSELQNATKDVEISVYCMSCRNINSNIQGSNVVFLAYYSNDSFKKKRQ